MQPQTDNRLAFHTIRDLQKVGTLREFWESSPGTRDSDFDFFSGLVGSRGQDCRPHVIVLTRNAAPDAMLIGLREHKKVPLKLGYITIAQPEVNILEFVRGGLRGNASEANCAALVQEVMRSLEEGDADLASWELDVRSPFYNRALRLPSFASRDHAHCLVEHWLMKFPKGLDAFFKSPGRHRRSFLHRKYKRVLGRLSGKMQIRSFRSITDLESAISDMEEIASKTDKRLFGGGFVDTPQMRAQMLVAAQKGWLRAYILYLEEKPAAFWMGNLYDGCLHADHSGYDPVWSKHSPGIFLFLNILEDLRDEDIKTIDFGWGNTQLNRSFADMRHIESHVNIYAPTLRGIQLNLLHTAAHRITHLCRRTHSLDWARRALRKQVLRQRRQPGPIAGCNSLSCGSTPELDPGSDLSEYRQSSAKALD
jgi:Acetyltransferase (GNAT) domain